MLEWKENFTSTTKSETTTTQTPDTSVKGKRCRYRGVDGTNFEGVVEQIFDWGEQIVMDDGTIRQVHYAGLIWIDAIEDQEEPDAITK